MLSLRKSRNILQTSYNWYKKKGQKLSPELRQNMQHDLTALDQAIRNQDRATADSIATRLEKFCKTHFKKSIFDYLFELIIALILALIVATIVRQMWFELYEIPTGSMRPTFREQDHLTVSKLTFGVNWPLETKHIYFNPDLVQRTSVLIFSGDNIPFIDSDTTYFGLIPYKKRYIKREIGKPGDTLYFYGGKIYGLDKDDNHISELTDSPWMKHLEHIPFLTFEGRITSPKADQIQFLQMNQPLGRITVSPTGSLLGEVFNGKEWVRDLPNNQSNAQDSKIHTYSDVWGMHNYAMARLLTRKQLDENPNIDAQGIPEGVLYLELRHDPNLTYPKPRFQQERQGLMVQLTPFVSVIPLQQKHLDALMDHMYTARFVVKDGQAARYNMEGTTFSANSPRFAGVPDGTYEFYYGKAVSLGWGGIEWNVPADSPLYKRDPSNIQKLYNLGIDFNTLYSPRAIQGNIYPQRYAYFRDGDLYLLGAPILKKDDQTLVAFNERESKKEQQSTASRPYVAFKDHGPPLKANGELDKEFIHTFGIPVTDRNYLVLGDNHAMSSDSRVFGFVPENNIQGAPSLIIWPPGDRLGRPEQLPYPILNIQRIFIWSIIGGILLIWYIIHRYNQRKPIKL